MRKLEQVGKQLKRQPDKQLSVTDPDARSTATSVRGSGIVGYNVQTTVNTEHHLIVAHEVTNVRNDYGKLSRITTSAKNATRKARLNALADCGYYSGPEIRACDLDNIIAHVLKPLTSASRKKGLFTKADIVYEPRSDVYRCPAGERAIHRFNTVEHGMALRVYWRVPAPVVISRINVQPATIAASNDGSTKTYWKRCGAARQEAQCNDDSPKYG